MAVSSHPLISNATHTSLLPSSWRTLYELTRLPDDVLRDALADGRIGPDSQRADLKDIRTRGRTTAQAKPAKTLTPQPVSFFKAGQRLFSSAQIKAMNSLDDGLKAELWLKFAEQIYPLLEDEQQQEHQHD